MKDVEQALFYTYYKDGIYHIQCSGLVPGPGHVYATLIVGKEKALLLDNGYGDDELAQYAKKLAGVPIIALVSHAHPDHMGGYRQFEDLWLNEKEVPLCQEWFSEAEFDEEKLILDGTRLHLLKEGNLELGERTVQIIETPGHTAGSICVYDEKTKIMLTGDTLSQRVFLFCAKPVIPFKVYKNSLQKLLNTDFQEFLAGHHPQPMPRSWTEKMIGMLDSFSPEKGRVYDRKEMGDSLMLYTSGKGFGDPEYCGFCYDSQELDELMA